MRSPNKLVSFALLMMLSCSFNAAYGHTDVLRYSYEAYTPHNCNPVSTRDGLAKLRYSNHGVENTHDRHPVWIACSIPVDYESQIWPQFTNFKITAGFLIDDEVGHPGILGSDGEDGEEINGKEYIYTRTRDNAPPPVPDNAWGYDNPGYSGDQEWTDGFVRPTEDYPYTWEAERLARGVYSFDEVVADRWLTPIVVATWTDSRTAQDSSAGPVCMARQDFYDSGSTRTRSFAKITYLDTYASMRVVLPEHDNLAFTINIFCKIPPGGAFTSFTKHAY